MKRQDGFVSLLTCIMISLLLLIVTVSTVSLETMQLRKAEDAEQSARAYYTAEAGVEDAVSKVLSGHLTDQPCLTATSTDTRNVGYDGSGSVGWTCQAIALNGNPEGTVDADKAVTIDAGAATYSKVLVEWDKWDASTIIDPLKSYTVPAALPVGANYQASYAAPPLEVTIAQYPLYADGKFSSSDGKLKLENALLVPSGGAPAGAPTFADLGAPAGNPVKGNCAAKRAVGANGQPTHYNCYAWLTLSSSATAGPASVDYLFRVRSRYMPSTYKLTFYDAGGNVVPVHTGMAKIDVTAKAGDAYRRVIANLMLPESAAPTLNYVMYSDGNVCKNFQVMSEVIQNSPPCP